MMEYGFIFFSKLAFWIIGVWCTYFRDDLYVFGSSRIYVLFLSSLDNSGQLWHLRSLELFR